MNQPKHIAITIIANGKRGYYLSTVHVHELVWNLQFGLFAPEPPDAERIFDFVKGSAWAEVLSQRFGPVRGNSELVIDFDRKVIRGHREFASPLKIAFDLLLQDVRAITDGAGRCRQHCLDGESLAEHFRAGRISLMGDGGYCHEDEFETLEAAANALTWLRGEAIAADTPIAFAHLKLPENWEVTPKDEVDTAWLDAVLDAPVDPFVDEAMEQEWFSRLSKPIAAEDRELCEAAIARFLDTDDQFDPELLAVADSESPVALALKSYAQYCQWSKERKGVMGQWQSTASEAAFAGHPGAAVDLLRMWCQGWSTMDVRKVAALARALVKLIIRMERVPEIWREAMASAHDRKLISEDDLNRVRSMPSLPNSARRNVYFAAKTLHLHIVGKRRYADFRSAVEWLQNERQKCFGEFAEASFGDVWVAISEGKKGWISVTPGVQMTIEPDEYLVVPPKDVKSCTFIDAIFFGYPQEQPEALEIQQL